MNKSLLVAGLSLGSLVVFIVAFSLLLKGCDGLLRAFCVDRRLLAVAAGATALSLAGLVATIVGWGGLAIWLRIAGIGVPLVIIGWWIKETILTL